MLIKNPDELKSSGLIFFGELKSYSLFFIKIHPE